jgi:hypothetical protein
VPKLDAPLPEHKFFVIEARCLPRSCEPEHEPSRSGMNRSAAPHTQLMLNLMGSFAEFEREIMLERQRE